MSKTQTSHMRQLQLEVDSAVETSTKSDLTRCARLLATYVALYKEQYGTLTNKEYEVLNRRLAENFDFGKSVYVNGMKELLETLALVETQASNDQAPPMAEL